MFVLKGDNNKKNTLELQKTGCCGDKEFCIYEIQFDDNGANEMTGIKVVLETGQVFVKNFGSSINTPINTQQVQVLRGELLGLMPDYEERGGGIGWHWNNDIGKGAILIYIEKSTFEILSADFGGTFNLVTKTCE